MIAPMLTRMGAAADRARSRGVRQVLVALCALALASCGGGPELVRRPASVPPALLIQDVSVLEVDTGVITSNREVLVIGDRIAAVAAVGETAPPAGTQTISGAGATLLPGLIDMHGHIGNSSTPPWKGSFPDPDANLRAYLYCGVTTVLDPADSASEAFKRRAAVAHGDLLGPHIFAAGPMFTATGGHPVALLSRLAPWWIRWYLVPRVTRQVDTPEAARAAVAEVVGLGADVIKLSVDRIPDDVPRLQLDVIRAAVEEAKARKIRTVAHIGSLDDAVDAAEAGVAAWMHGVYKERIPDDRIAPLAAYGIPMVVTMNVFESYALLGQQPRVATPLERETVPRDVLEAFDHVPTDGSLDFFQPYVAHLRAQRDAWRDNVRRLRAAGVTILAGSDTQMGVFPGAGLHRELELLTEAGLTPAEAIRAATLDAARFLAARPDPDFGIVAAGKRADLLLVDGSPTLDLGALARIRAVIKDGVMLERHPLGAS